MKLLFIIPYAPTQIRTRPYHFLRFLARRGHEIVLATLWGSPEERKALTELENWGIQVHAFPLGRSQVIRNTLSALASGVPVQARYSRDVRLEKVIREILADASIEAVHIEHLRGAVYGEAARGFAGRDVPVIWDCVDSISYLFSQAAEKSVSRFGQIASKLELGRTRDYEGQMLHRFDRVIVTSPRDRQELLALAAQADPSHSPLIRVVPNGVDTELFFPIDEPDQKDTIIFTGKMSYHANVTAVVRFVQDVMPQIWRSRVEVKLLVAGKDPVRQVQKLGGDPRVRILGTVDLMRPYLSRAAVSVAPISYGAGIQNKVLEAMACRTAVVASPQAVSALQADRGTEVVVANGSDDFASAVLRLLENPEYCASVAGAGYDYVLKNHRWEEAASRLEDVYREAIQSFA